MYGDDETGNKRAHQIKQWMLEIESEHWNIKMVKEIQEEKYSSHLLGNTA